MLSFDKMDRLSLIAQIEDLTKQNQFLEQQLSEAQNLFTSKKVNNLPVNNKMIFELKASVNAIVGFIHALGEEMAGPITPEQEDIVEIINENCSQLLSIIQEF